MNWDDLRIFDAAARTLSLSAAARRVGLSQPQLSRRLRRLEENMGARLFERLPQGLKPTRAGQHLIPLVAGMRDAADAVERARPGISADMMHVVRVSVDDVREHILAGALPDLRERLEGIEIEILASHDHVNHVARETDIQIRSCLPETDSLIARKLGHLAYAVYGSRGYVAGAPAAMTDDRFHACEWVGLVPDQLWYPEQHNWLARQGVSRCGLRVNTMTAALSAVLAGSGLAVLPCFMADADPRLVRVMAPEPDLLSTEHLIVHRDLLREPAVRRTIDALADAYRKNRDVLLGEIVAEAAE